MEKTLKIADGTQDALLLADAMEDSTESAEALNTAMKRVQSTVKTTAKFVRHFVADFDELQKLPEKEMTVSTTVKNDETQLAEGITDGQLYYRIRQATLELQNLYRHLTEEIRLTNQNIHITASMAQNMYENVRAISDYLLYYFPEALKQLYQELNLLLPSGEKVLQMLKGQGYGLEALYQSLRMTMLPTLKDLNQEFSAMSQRQGVLNTLQKQWKTHWQDMAQTLRSSANDMIRYCNMLMEATAMTVNTMGKFSAAMPGSNYRPVQVVAPKIPALARGAVLPANRPFLAMVGDQRHGTNVEAPLATIQEAVAAVTADQTGAIVAGFEASVGVQREILEAVLGISIGDETVAKACRRYEQKMAVVRGG